jgi:hypothetical protein
VLKARSKDKLVFGLSARNIELLMDGKPILIDLRELGYPEGQVLIFYGTTEEAMKQQLEEAGIELDTNKDS